jgi:preprotein translocase subunit SecG
MTLPFALSIHNFVNSVGSYVGFASIVAVAILVLLYFAHSRETATLRDRLEEAQQRISGLEARIGQLMQMQQRGRPPGPAPVAPPVPVRPPGAPQGSVRRVPNPATAAGVATAPAAALAQAAVAPRAAGVAPSAPAGVGGPALASATKVIPDATGAGAPDDTMFVAPAAATNGKTDPEHTAVLAKATPAAAAAARPASASPRAAAPPPRMQIGADEPAAPATPAGGSKVRRIGGHPEPAAVPLPAFDDQSVGGGRFSGAILPLVIAGIAAVVIIVGLIVISNNGGTSSGNVGHGNKNNTTAGTTGQTLHKTKTVAAPFSATKVTVAVLNGTAQQGLAGDVGKKLTKDGYKQGNVTNAASQTDSSTFVYFVSKGAATKANRTAAQHVAKALALPASRVRAAGAGVIQSCTISDTGASLGSCRANVIVSVGQDRVNLASASG